MNEVTKFDKLKRSKRKENGHCLKKFDEFQIVINNNRFKINENKKRKRYNIIIIYLLICILSNRPVYTMMNSKVSFIILKINGKGNIKIFDNKNLSPDAIYIDEEKQNNIKNILYFKDIPNYVKLEWNKEIISSASMFIGCNNIVEIDLSHFNTSKITNMSYMFQNCSSLTSLNLSNFDTSKVFNMDCMFNGCSSLVFLDLSSFDTSKVSSMAHTFYGCSSLISLDLSNFNTYLISQCHIFYGCTNLKYLNLKNAKLNEHFINQINTFLTLEGITLSDTNKELKTKLTFWNLIITCINNLYDISNSNYKIDGYYKSKSNNDINGCKYCGLEYYKIYNDITNTNSYYKCHKSLDGYYIDYNDLFYKPCYSSCKKCKINGNITNHNCIECANDYKYELDDIYFINCYNICSYYFYYDTDKNKSYCTTKLECPENYRYLIIIYETIFYK